MSHNQYGEINNPDYNDLDGEVKRIIDEGNKNIQSTIDQGNKELEERLGHSLPQTTISEDSARRQEELNVYRDQVPPVGPAYNLPQTEPDRSNPNEPTNRSLLSVEDLRRFRDQNNVGINENLPQTEPDRNNQNSTEDLVKDLRDIDNTPEVKYDSNRKLQRSLNPEKRKENPLEELQRQLSELQSHKQADFAKDVEKTMKDGMHQGVLNSNTEANKGIYNTKPLSENGQNFFKNEDQIAENARVDRRHQDALDSNARANEGVPANNPLSNTGRTFFNSEDMYRDSARQTEENARQAEQINSLRQTIENLKLQIDLLEDSLQALMDGQTPDPIPQPTPNPEPIPNPIPGPIPNPEPIPNPIPGPIPNPEPIPNPIPGPIPNPMPQEMDANNARLADLENQLRELRGQNTPEQRATELQSQMDVILNGRLPSQLSDEERLRYFDLSLGLQEVRRGINIIDEEKTKKRRNKERILKAAALVVGGVGGFMAAPALSVGAIVAVSLGGNLAAPLIKRWSDKVRSKSEALKYESRGDKTLTQLADMDKRQKRNEWWANRLGEIASVVGGGATGFGLGVIAHNIFNAVSATHSAATQQPPTPGNNGLGNTNGSLGTQPGSTPAGSTVPNGTETLSTDPGLVQNGHINLPGSAWNGNLAGGPTGNLPGGELNFSNYPGGIENMAGYMLNKDLVAAGISPDQLHTLGTMDIHRGLLNGYLSAIRGGTPDPNLADILGNMNTDAARNLLSAIQ